MEEKEEGEKERERKVVEANGMVERTVKVEIFRAEIEDLLEATSRFKEMSKLTRGKREERRKKKK